MPIHVPSPSRPRGPAHQDLHDCNGCWPPHPRRRQLLSPGRCRHAVGLLAWLAATGMATSALAQVRGKTQDRGSYQPPVLSDTVVERADAIGDRAAPQQDSATALRKVAYDSPTVARRASAPVVVPSQDVYYQSAPVHGAMLPPGSLGIVDASCGVEPACGLEPFAASVGPACGVEPFCGSEGLYPVDPGCGLEASFGEPTCGAGPTCGGCGDCQRCLPAESFCLTPDRMFGSVELLLWWRQGQSLPPLVTTGPASAGRNVAGRLGQASTRVLFGGDQGDSLSAGGRFTLGTWLDDCGYRSLTGRFWGSGSENYTFSVDDSQVPVITRPFFDVDGNTQNTSVVAFPNQLQGNLTVNGHSEVYGADVSLAQLWRTGLGGNVDFLYGYQFLRVNEDLNIHSSSRVTGTGQTLPAGAMITLADSFDVQNEFHGAHFGASGKFREGCWTYSALFKLAFGSLSRRAQLRGATVTSNGGQVATTEEGLLVRATNAGDYDDSTFAWMPELNFDLAYRIRRDLDFSVGYSLVVLTDALQPWQTIDPILAVDLPADPATAERPIAAFQYDDFWLQGLNFGLHWNY